MNRLLPILLLTLLIGCKSVKKHSTDLQTTTQATALQQSKDSTQRATRAEETIITAAKVTEETIKGLQPLDSAGITVFKPYERTVKYSDTTTEEHRTTDSTRHSVTEQAAETLDIAQHNASTLDKELESEPIIGPLADILFPTWLKIASMLLIVLISCGFGLWQRRKNKRVKQQIDQELTNP